ncbi:MAG TPA: methyltransferase domain-containing protein, partial [Parafilimonas sp.]|nr:methyltransferase domain-containing protein [Parafilimonas sp.]
KHWSNSLGERISFVKSTHSSFSLEDVFRFTTELSDGIDTTSFVQSHLLQPDVFLRIRPHCREQVIQTLQQNAIAFTLEADDCIRLPPTVNVENSLKLDKEVVVQDASSQQIKKYLEPVRSPILNPQSEIPNPLSVWDCCAGSGGKSILSYDTFPNIELTATDIRPSIIHNLRKRFQNAGINHYRANVIDITNTVGNVPALKIAKGFDLIICDAPCTGSGTWSRTPEQLFFFTENKIDDYATLQRSIVSNAIPLLKGGGYFLYITCSVFKKENEEIIAFIKSKFHLQLVKMELLKGYTKKADSMFAGLFSSDTIAQPA